MPIKITEDIRSVTDLKKNANNIVKQLHSTGRPIVLTVNGRAEAVMLAANEYEKMAGAFSVLQKLIPAENDVAKGRTKAASSFFAEFRRAQKIQG